jgi:hypothetical protein
MIGIAYVVVLALLTVLSIRTMIVLGGAAPWTSLGWLFTVGYDVSESYKILTRIVLPAHFPYLMLGALAIAFTVAGLRDEPQGEPWWWPRVRGARRADRAPLREK